MKSDCVIIKITRKEEDGVNKTEDLLVNKTDFPGEGRLRISLLTNIQFSITFNLTCMNLTRDDGTCFAQYAYMEPYYLS